MCCSLQILRKIHFFWRYRSQNNNFQTCKFYLIVFLINLLMSIFYFCYYNSPIADQYSIHLITTITLHFSTTISLLVTHSINPGKIPQIKKMKNHEISLTTQKSESQLIPINNKIQFSENHTYCIINGGQLKEVVFCNTCNIYRPNLTSHCGRCKGCIQELDHHCEWLANCIGKRNYRLYYMSLTSSSGLCGTVFLRGIFDWLGRGGEIQMIEVLSVGLGIMAGLVGVWVLFLWSIHTYFGIVGISTRTFIKNYKQSKSKPNPSTSISLNDSYLDKINHPQKNQTLYPKPKPISQTQINYQSTTTTSQHFNFGNQSQLDHQQNDENIHPQMIISKVPFIGNQDIKINKAQLK